MYSSLDRIDITSQKDGKLIYMQTDHRSYTEISQDLELSMAFALIKVLGPMGMARSKGEDAELHYAAKDSVPFAFHQAIASAGGLLMVDFIPVPFTGKDADVGYLLNNTFCRIAHNMAEEKGLSLDAQGVRALEQSLDLEMLKEEENEIEYWETVIKVGSFAAEAMKRQSGGKWIQDQHGQSALAVVFEAGGLTVNPFGKTMKLIENGLEDSVAFLVEVVAQKLGDEKNPDLSGPEPLATGPDSVPRGGGAGVGHGARQMERKPQKKKGFFARLLGK